MRRFTSLLVSSAIVLVGFGALISASAEQGAQSQKTDEQEMFVFLTEEQIEEVCDLRITPKNIRIEETEAFSVGAIGYTIGAYHWRKSSLNCDNLTLFVEMSVPLPESTIVVVPERDGIRNSDTPVFTVNERSEMNVLFQLSKRWSFDPSHNTCPMLTERYGAFVEIVYVVPSPDSQTNNPWRLGRKFIRANFEVFHNNKENPACPYDTQ